MRGVWVLAMMVASAGAQVPVSGLVSRQGIAVDRRLGVALVVDQAASGVVEMKADGSLTKVATGKGPVAIAVDEARHWAFVANADDASVSVVDEVAGRVRATVKVTARPYAIAVDARLGRVYVSHTFSGMLTVMDEETGTLREVKTGSADALLVSGGKVYLMGYESDSVRVLDEATDSVTTLGAGGMHLWGMVKVGGTLWVSHVQDSSVAEVDLATGMVGNVAVGRMPCAMASDEGHAQIWVAGYDGGEVSVVDVRTKAVVGSVEVGGHPQAVAVDGLRRRVYVADAREGVVTVIDADARTVVERVKVAGGPYAVAVVGKRVVAATSGVDALVVVR